MKKFNMATAAMMVFGVVSMTMILTTSLEAGRKQRRFCEVKETSRQAQGLPRFVNLPDGPLTGKEDFLKDFSCAARDGVQAACGWLVREGQLKCLVNEGVTF